MVIEAVDREQVMEGVQLDEGRGGHSGATAEWKEEGGGVVDVVGPMVIVISVGALVDSVKEGNVRCTRWSNASREHDSYLMWSTIL